MRTERDLKNQIAYAKEEGLEQGRKQGLQQGLEQGREEGREQGREEERARIMEELRKQGVPEEVITRAVNKD